MKRHNDEPAECDMCVGNRQLLQQLANEVAELRAAYERSPMRLETAQIQPGDVIVVTSEMRLPMAQLDEIVNGLKAKFPGVEGIVMDGGLHLGVVRPDTLPVRDGGC